MKLYKMIFTITMMMGTLIAISSYSWLSMWMGLEINLLSIIPLLYSQKNMFSSESSLKYFIVQAIASMVLLMSVIMLLSKNEFIAPTMNFYFMMTLNSALLTKLGAAPFHFWFPEVMEGLNWMNCLIMLTWQKIAPMSLLMNNLINYNFIMTIIIACLIISSFMALNQISMRKILTFSSINHIGWMLSSMMMSLSTWTIYFTIYTILNINIIVILKATKSYYLKQINNILNKNKILKMTYMTNFLSLGGLPPFLGFMPKWLVINWLTEMGLFMTAITMIILTLIMLYVYIRISFSSMMMSFSEPKINFNEINSKLMTAINLMTMTSLILCTLIFNLL